MTKLDITMAVPGLPFNGETFDKQSLGGSESAGYYMARALAALGHKVTVFCDTQPVRCADVDYLPISMFRQYVEFSQHDVCIVQRQPELMPGICRARLSLFWCHDLALRRMGGIVNGSMWNFDKVLVLSEFMRDQYKQAYGLPDEVLFVTRNGVDLAAVARAKAAVPAEVRPNPLSLVYSARPERGLDILLGEVMPRILKHEPQARLFLSTYLNPTEQLADFYTHCKMLSDRLGDRVVFLGHLTKERLYEVYHSAGLYTYPLPSRPNADFDEIYCISAAEAQACGLPIVCSARGALPETVAPEAGVLISEPVHTEAYYEAFAGACLRLMRDPAAWQAASAAALARGATLDWAPVAEQWTAMFERELRGFSADLSTLANHFWRQSDIYAARECLKRLPLDDRKSTVVRGRIARDWAFLDEEDGFRKQYERIGGTHDPRVIEWAPKEPRYAALKQWLERHGVARARELQPTVDAIAVSHPLNLEHFGLSVLDYGCAHGAYAVNLLKEHPWLRVTGVDIDIHGIEMACGFAEKLGVADRWRGVVGDMGRLTDPHVPEMTEQYDVVVAQEVLEHVPDPPALLRQLEERVRDGGMVYITVPFGPWEYTDYLRRWGSQTTKGYPHRAHVWNFDLHDLEEMLDIKGREAEVTKQAMPFGHEPNTNEPLGWWVIMYRVTPATRGKVGQIDMERKLWLQRPRQTVSASLMVGGDTAEETLHWCLRSLEHVADEVVLIDCGMTPEARRLLEAYDERLVVVPNGPDPKLLGFETGRNVGLEHCTQDWVLWIDTDEKLLQPWSVTKYLRPNMFQGYSIRQHHFAVDTHFDADMPVRLFRNNGKLRFFGMIHEHPESALNEGPGRTIVLTDAHIAHVGYLIESGRQQRFQRNLPMLKADIAKYPTRKLQKHFIMRDNMLLVSYELQQNGGRISGPMRELCQEVVDIYREHFLGKGHFTNVDPIAYYSQAAQVLGDGFSMGFQVAADKFQAKPNGALVVHFSSTEDAVKEITWRVKSAAQPFEGRYY